MLIAVLLLGFGLRLFHLDNQSLWWDEIKTIDRATGSLAQLIANILVKRDQVPFYYMLMQVWVRLGTGAFVVRFFSVISGVFNVALVYQIGRSFGSRLTGVLAAFFLAVSPFHIYYSQEARMYTLMPTAVLLAHWFLLRIFQKATRWNWAGYGLAMLAAIYTHYFSALILLAHYIFFALHFRRVKKLFGQWIVTTAVVTGLVGFWIRQVMQHNGYNESVPGWIPAAKWVEPLITFFTFSAGSTIEPARLSGWIVLVIYLLGMGMVLTTIRPPATTSLTVPVTQQRWFRARFLLCWTLVPILLTYLISLDMSPLFTNRFSIYMDRYLIGTLPGLVLVSAWGLVQLAKRRGWPWLVWAGAAGVAVFTLPSLHNLYTNPAYARLDMQTAVSTLSTHAQPNDVLFGGSDLLLPLAYYAQDPIPLVELPPPVAVASLQETFAGVMTKQLATAPDADRAWVLTTLYNSNPHGFPDERNRLVNKPDAYQRWFDERYEPVQKWTFPGVRLALYQLEEIGDWSNP